MLCDVLIIDSPFGGLIVHSRPSASEPAIPAISYQVATARYIGIAFESEGRCDKSSSADESTSWMEGSGGGCILDIKGVRIPVDSYSVRSLNS